MKKIKIIWPLTAATLLLLATTLQACSVLPGGSKLTLEGTNWILKTYLDAAGQEAQPLAETTVTARFIEGNVVGSDGCNSYQATYTVDGKNLTIKPGISTMMACLEPVMAQATAYNQNMANAATYRIQGESLEIADAQGKTTLTYQAGADTPAGMEWVATAINNGKGALASVLADTEVTAVFGEDGNLSGSAGCNTYNASYTAKDGTIQIGPAATTRMMCAEPAGVMEQEAAYLAALSQAVTYELSGKTLTLRDADGAGMVTYTQK